jgi:hypothetical protein
VGAGGQGGGPQRAGHRAGSRRLARLLLFPRRYAERVGYPPYQYWDNPTDQKAHGGVPWVEYYLQQMQQFEQQNGYRLLDVVDVHGYIAPDR